MAAPAPVSCAGVDGGAWQRTTACLEGLAVAALTAWAAGLARGQFDRADPWSAHALGWLACAVGGLWAAWRWHRPSPSASPLRWDGQFWRWGDLVGRATIAVDLEAWMLVRFEVGDTGGSEPPRLAGSGGALPRSVWLPLSPAHGPADWPALRAALYWSSSPARAQVLPGPSTGRAP
jgi:hypothetical protein